MAPEIEREPKAIERTTSQSAKAKGQPTGSFHEGPSIRIRLPPAPSRCGPDRSRCDLDPPVRIATPRVNLAAPRHTAVPSGRFSGCTHTLQTKHGECCSRIWVYNPAYAQVQNEHVFPNAWVAIMKDGLTPQAAADKAFKRVEEIFAQYPIAQG